MKCIMSFIEVHIQVRLTQKNNRKSELLYRQAEMLSSIALNKFNAKYPIEELTEGWKVILLNQFHDIIPVFHK